jgi:hypothetical protein
MRLCEKCRAAENPLGRLRFRKYLDGKVYCENCIPASVEVLAPTPPELVSSSLPGTSAGSLVVIPCPTCLGQGRGSRTPTNVHLTKCAVCSGYGRVRVPENFLNVYTPDGVKSEQPKLLTEG